MSFENKRVLFIATKELSYIRNVQEINMLRGQAASLEIIGSDHKSYLKRILTIYLKILMCNSKKYDAIFIGFAPQLVLPLFFWKWRKKEVVIDFFISVFDTFVDDRKRVGRNHILAKLMWQIDRFTLNQADYVIADTKEHGNYFCKEFHIESKKVETIYLEANKEIFYSQKVEKPDKWKDKYLVLYFGSILPCQGVDVILKAVETLREEEQIQFVIIGPLSEKKSQKNATYIPWLEQKELAKYIAMADLCLAGHFHPEIGKAKRTIPGKAYIYEAMEKPMILGDNPANHELFIKDKNHYFVEMGNAEELAVCIQQLYQSYRGEQL